MPTLAVCIPWQSPFFFTKTAFSLMQLQHPPGWNVEFVQGEGWGPARRHNDAMEQALELGADYMLILGADQRYPRNLLRRLVARIEEGYEVIAGLVPSRGYVPFQNMQPFQPMAWRWKTAEEMGLDANDPAYYARKFRSMAEDNDMVHIIKRSEGDVQRIDFIGSGCLMFHRDHLLSLKRPWFYETIDIATQQRIANMDTRFVARLRTEAQASCWVDTTIKMTHSHIFDIDDTFSDRFADWALLPGDPTICMDEDKTRQLREHGSFLSVNGHGGEYHAKEAQAQ